MTKNKVLSIFLQLKILAKLALLVGSCKEYKLMRTFTLVVT